MHHDANNEPRTHVFADAVQRLYVMPIANEEGSLHTRRVRIWRKTDGDVPVQPSRAETQHVSTESTRYAATLLALISQVSVLDIRDNVH